MIREGFARPPSFRQNNKSRGFSMKKVRITVKKIVRHDMGEDLSWLEKLPEEEYLKWGCEEYLRNMTA